MVALAQLKEDLNSKDLMEIGEKEMPLPVDLWTKKQAVIPTLKGLGKKWGELV
jgi:hypothetical protein